MSLLITSSWASEVMRTPVDNYFRTENDFMFEVQTSDFPRVILDCQSFINNFSFYKNESGSYKAQYEITLDNYQCYSIDRHIVNQIEEKTPICIEFDVKENSLFFSSKSASECQSNFKLP